MRYYSAKADVLVTRYGTGSYIGATVGIAKEGERKGETVITHDPDAVVAITDAEFSKYTREYLQLVRDGSLIERDEADHKVWLEAEEAQVKKETAEREAAVKKATAEVEAEIKKKALAAETAKAKAKDEAEAKKKAAAAEKARASESKS